MTTMFGRPSTPITEAVHATPSRHSRSVLAAYPGFDDWRRLYDPNGSKGQSWNLGIYENMKRGHERSVDEQLDTIAKSSAGQAVFAEMNARPSYSVMILPFDFLPSRSWKVGTGAVARAIDSRAEWAAGVPMCGHRADGTLFCFDNSAGHKVTGRGSGSSVDIYFTPRRHADRLEPPDEVLLHELTHASRKVRGVLYRMPMGGGYGNQEEFLAVLVTNIYRSQKGETRLFDYRGHSIDPGAFLDSVSPSPPLRDRGDAAGSTGPVRRPRGNPHALQSCSPGRYGTRAVDETDRAVVTLSAHLRRRRASARRTRKAAHSALLMGAFSDPATIIMPKRRLSRWQSESGVAVGRARG